MIARDQEHVTKVQLRLGIEQAQGHRLIGTCAFFNIKHTCRRAEIGYGLDSTTWGYIHEALRAVLDYGFNLLNLNRVEADIDPRNAASAKTLERLEFTKEGYLRERWIVGDEVSDTALYSLLQREWRSKP